MTFEKLGGLLMRLALFVSYYVLRKTDLCHPFPQRFEKRFVHEGKYSTISLNNTADN